MDPLLAFFALARLAEGIFCVRWGVRFKRTAVTVWGAVDVLLVFPVAALAFGVHLPHGPVVAIAGGHAVLGMCVCAAVVSSTAVSRPSPNDRWRP